MGTARTQPEERPARAEENPPIEFGDLPNGAYQEAVDAFGRGFQETGVPLG